MAGRLRKRPEDAEGGLGSELSLALAALLIIAGLLVIVIAIVVSAMVWSKFPF